MFQLDHLPDDCLCLILERCNLQQLLRLRAVCTRWCLVIERMCRKSRSLQVFETARDLDEYRSMRYYFLANRQALKPADNFAQGDNVLLIGPKAALLASLASLFPNLETLLIVYSQAFLSLSAATCPPHLNTITLVAKKRSGDIPHRVWAWINSIKSLRSLSLFGMYDYRLPDLPVLSQLQLFCLTGYDGDVVPVIAQLGPNLRHLLLDRLSLPVERLDRLLSEAVPHLRRSLTHLSVGALNTGMVSQKGYIQKIKRFMSFFCEHFTQLHYLCVRFALQIPLGDLVTELARLPRLIELRLAQIGSSNPKEEPSLATLPRIESVNRVYLESNTSKAALDPFWRYWIPAIFPRLEHFQIHPESDGLHRLSLLRVQ